MKLFVSIVLGGVFVVAGAAMPRIAAPEPQHSAKTGKPGIVICFPAPPSCYGCHSNPPYPCQEDQ